MSETYALDSLYLQEFSHTGKIVATSLHANEVSEEATTKNC